MSSEPSLQACAAVYKLACHAQIHMPCSYALLFAPPPTPFVRCKVLPLAVVMHTIISQCLLPSPVQGTITELLNGNHWILYQLHWYWCLSWLGGGGGGGERYELATITD